MAFTAKPGSRMTLSPASDDMPPVSRRVWQVS